MSDASQSSSVLSCSYYRVYHLSMYRTNGRQELLDIVACQNHCALVVHLSRRHYYGEAGTGKPSRFYTDCLVYVSTGRAGLGVSMPLTGT